MNFNTTYVKPGILEIYCGPMKSGKSKKLFDRYDKLKYIKGCNILFIKPNIDTRDSKIKSRYSSSNIDCHLVDSQSFEDIIILIESMDINILFIDEIQLFSEDFKFILNNLLKNGLHIIGAGLDMDFKGEPFGFMKYVLAIANNIYKLKAVCEFEGCFKPATRSQRLINGIPASFNEPIISIEGKEQEERYEARCLDHHFIKRD